MTNKEEEVSIDNTNSMNTTRYKVVFVGDMSVGKTSIVLRFLGNKFTDLYSVRINIK
jgi:GTPase SAR1 family protein